MPSLKAIYTFNIEPNRLARKNEGTVSCTLAIQKIIVRTVSTILAQTKGAVVKN